MWFTKEGLLSMVTSMISFRKKGTSSKSLNLYDSIENLPVQTFFEILKSENLNLLNPQNQKVGQEELQAIWDDIREDYYKESNPQQYREDLKRGIRINKLSNEIIGCSAAISYFELTGEILSTFKAFGYTVKNAEDVDKVRHKMLVRKTKLGFLIPAKKEQDKKEIINFWAQVASLESALNRQLDIDKITVARWVNYIKQIKEQRIQNEQQRKNR